MKDFKKTATCPICHNEFVQSSRNQKYCSVECRDQRAIRLREERRIINKEYGLCPCGKKREPGYKTCVDCRNTHYLSSKKRIAEKMGVTTNRPQVYTQRVPEEWAGPPPMGIAPTSSSVEIAEILHGPERVTLPRYYKPTPGGWNVLEGERLHGEQIFQLINGFDGAQ